MDPKQLRIEDYTYHLPENRIARYPLKERDASKLLISKEGKITEDIYRNIAQYIPADTLMVFNQTKVVNARLLFKKESGSIIEVFCLAPDEMYASIHTAMLQTQQVRWECLVGGASKWKEGMVLHLNNEQPFFTLSASIISRIGGTFILQMEWDNDTLTFAEILHYAGKVPLPPYLNREAEADDVSRYQTLYAKEAGSVAAPTAGLHFTNEVLKSLEIKEIDAAVITLHVGAGTFKPVKASTMTGHEMHAEWMEVSYNTVKQLLRNIDQKNIVAVGTTSLRTLESLYWIGNKLAWDEIPNLDGIAVSQWEPYDAQWTVTTERALLSLATYMENHGLDKLVTRTQIMIAPGYTFRIVNGLVTNFHQPQSTLLLLVAAFTNGDWRLIYNHALNNGYRFLSYGDGCLLWRKTLSP